MRLAALLICLLLPLPAFCAGARHVVIISVDGLRPDALTKAEAPAMQRLLAQGSGTLSAQTVLPSLTLPSHTSMLTGVGVAKHQMTWNSWKPELGVVKVPTVFEVARRAGLSTAMFVGKEKFQHLKRPESLDAYDMPDSSAAKVAAAAAAHLVTNQPRLLFVHLADVDTTGHRLGWMSPFQIKAVARCDAGVARVLAGIEQAGIADRTAVIVTADHGGHWFTHGSDRPEDMTIPWIAIGAGIRPANALTAPVHTCDTAATALALLGIPVPADWDGKPVAPALAALDLVGFLVAPLD